MNDLEIRSKDLLTDIQEMNITEDNYLTAGILLRNIKKLSKEIETHHKESIESAYKAHKAALNAKKRLLEPVNLAEKLLKDKLNEFFGQDPKNIKGLTYTDSYTFEIVSEKIIPKEFWTVDTKRIGEVVRALKEACTIPGIKVIKKNVIKVQS